MRFVMTTLVLSVLGLGGGPHVFAADICATNQNLVANCGFESGNFSSWTLSGTDSGPLNNGIYYGIESYNQYSGNNAAYFGAVNGEITLSQPLTVIPTYVYTITLEALNDTTPASNYINNLIFSLGAVTTQVASQVVAGGYTLYTAEVYSQAASTTLAISSRNDAGFWNVDSIQVVETATPEPSALLLSFAGLAVLAFWGLRHRAWKTSSNCHN